ncbi:MAG: hypothetical protein IKC56_00170 [Clostridia bacterium]|nr:hypothetical protein [Clostridia bacterium]
MLGIGGIGVSALAVYLRQMGKEVFGYDKNVNTDLVRRLRAYGISVTANFADLPDAEVTVYSGAFTREDLVAQLGGESIFLSRAELLGMVMQTFSTSVAIAGSHGKTTATAMLGEILRGTPSTVFLGGEYPPFAQRGGFGNLYHEGEGLCLVEACEYRQSFLFIRPPVAVALNVEEDHMDCYANFHCLKDAFRRYLEGGNVTVVNVDDPVLSEYPATVTYGLCKRADYYAENLRSDRGKYSFDCFERGKFRGRISLSVCGKHNVYNALAAIATARQLFIPFSVILQKLSEFSGVDRRNTYLGEYQGKKTYADYAHHPTEIQATVCAFREAEDEDFSVVFQPHTRERTAYLYQEFCKVLNQIPNLAIYSTYLARASQSAEGEELLQKGVNAPLIQSPQELEKYIASLPKTITRVLVLGAGDIYEIARKLIYPVTK